MRYLGCILIRPNQSGPPAFSDPVDYNPDDFKRRAWWWRAVLGQRAPHHHAPGVGRTGQQPRYIVTNLTADAQALYDEVCCKRGEAENRIKEAQVGLFATRTSCQQFQGNQLRMLLAVLGT